MVKEVKKVEGYPGFGKSRMLVALGKPKWMPLWLHRLHMRKKWVDFPMVELTPEDFAGLPTIRTGNNFDPSDIAPGAHTAKPRPWPSTKKRDQGTDQ